MPSATKGELSIESFLWNLSKIFYCFFPDGDLLPIGKFLLCADVPIVKKGIEKIPECLGREISIESYP